ncbi:hypothetical protein PGT21_011663 [Puccinia graminis f. sp. tritici]|uniref:Uncharacterized protein n=1 Tax=Puccinia graminis f. sp. tritici TaxID=56615 RepID=A0A5B0RPG3_PUCGR|nr:hypothetical protein PGT21_011663 [Puccinia graminis f. sp. tritici]KAA1126723.1 hypothetical protein PGTUg99_008985 [Puccinia graminis f. sp. tritici]
MVTFDHVDFAFQKTKTTCMVADLKIATPKHANSDTRVCSFLAQVPPSEARFASGTSQPRSPGPQKRGTCSKLDLVVDGGLVIAHPSVSV